MMRGEVYERMRGVCGWEGDGVKSVMRLVGGYGWVCVGSVREN